MTPESGNPSSSSSSSVRLPRTPQAQREATVPPPEWSRSERVGGQEALRRYGATIDDEDDDDEDE